MMFVILRERLKDRVAIETLLDDVFGVNRHHKTSYAFRDGNDPVQGLSFTAHHNEKLVGSIRFWPITLGIMGTPALLLGPLGVAQYMQNFGIGRSLISKGHMMAAKLGYKLVLLVGEEAYYGQFGYEFACSHGLFMVGEKSTRLLVRELVKGALKEASGDVHALDCPQSDIIGSKIEYYANC